MKVYVRLVAIIAVMLSLICLSTQHSFAQESPIVDGNYEEYARLGVKPIAISKDVELYIYQDNHYVWLCYNYPEGSFGTVDLKLKTAMLTEPINLHVSAQIGEWPADKPELAPQSAESERWWNANGWTANPVWINGMDTTKEKPRYRFKNAKARELQLSKRRFGRGDWLFSLNIRSIKGADGKLYDIVFPKMGEYYTLKAL